MDNDPIISDEYIESLFNDPKHGNKYSTVWIEDVDINSDEVIGLEIVNDILCITVAKYVETAYDRKYEVISQFAVDTETFRSALDYLDIVNK